MSARPDLRVPGLSRVLAAAARTAALQAGGTPVAALAGAGISAERFVRRAIADQQRLVARWCGVASRQEVLRLRELVRALEYRLEQLDRGAPRSEGEEGS